MKNTKSNFYSTSTAGNDFDIEINSEFTEHLDKVINNISTLLKIKNQAYGNSALKPANIFSKLNATEALCSRIDDKLMRISNKGINDQTEDTINDLIGYLLLLVMALEREGS